MGQNGDLKNCRIVIRDVSTGETIADTTILTYDMVTKKVEISVDQVELPAGAVISALIFSPEGLLENQGTVGDRDGERVVITFYEGTAKNDRQALRYQVNIQGEVDAITRPGVGKLPGEFMITVLNMSSIGLLIQAPEGKIQREDIVRFSATTKGQRIIITALATRVEQIEAGMEKIGCSIQLVNLG